MMTIDIGGTGIDLYKMHGSKVIHEHISFEKRQIEYNDSSEYTAMIEKIISGVPRAKLNSITIGLPGPVEAYGQTEVFCPPLGTTIKYKTFLERGIKVVNDVCCQVSLLNMTSIEESYSKINMHSSLITIGTSLGYCTFKASSDLAERLNSAKSYELAHLHFKDLEPFTQDLKICSQVYGNNKLHTLFSAGGLCKFLGGKVESKNSMIVTSSRELRKCLQDHRNVEKFDKWLNFLSQACNAYSKKITSEIQHSKPFLRGGFLTAIKDSSIPHNAEKYFVLGC